jgi:hypothetical protein
MLDSCLERGIDAYHICVQRADVRRQIRPIALTARWKVEMADRPIAGGVHAVA